jgi:predicted  nucleic acid-binding Zn-ribbon protein
MPVKSRMIEEKRNEIANRKSNFESELEAVRLELQTAQSGVVKGTTDIDSLISIQTRVNVVEQTITALGSQIDALEADLVAQKGLETKREIFSKIKVLDDTAEKAGSRFIELYTDIESVSYARFVEMSALLARIADLKSEFGRYVVTLIPNVNKLKSRDMPELRSELDNLITELKNTCRLSVLRSDRLFSDRAFVTDDDHAFRLPENDLGKWIWLSIRVIREREQQKQRGLPVTEKAGFFSKVLGIS